MAMNADLVRHLYCLLEQGGVPIWIDGGWGVDALLGRQTRAHADLDIQVEARLLPKLRAVLAASGFEEIARADSVPWMFVLSDGAGNEVDVHAVDIDAEGRAVLGPLELGQIYPAGALDGVGVIQGTSVRCVSAEAMMIFKTSFVQRDIDRADVAALREHFGIAAPGA